MLDRFLAVKGVSPSLVLAFALGKQAHQLRDLADDLYRTVRSLSAPDTATDRGNAVVPDLERVEAWVRALAKVVDRLSRVAGHVAAARTSAGPDDPGLDGLRLTLDQLLNRQRRLRRAAKELDGLIRSLGGSTTHVRVLTQALARQRDGLLAIREELRRISKYVGLGFDPLYAEGVRVDRRRGCRHPERLARMRELLQAGHTLSQVSAATGIPRGVAYYLFHQYLAEAFPAAVVPRGPTTRLTTD